MQSGCRPCLCILCLFDWAVWRAGLSLGKKRASLDLFEVLGVYYLYWTFILSMFVLLQRLVIQKIRPFFLNQSLYVSGFKRKASQDVPRIYSHGNASYMICTCITCSFKNVMPSRTCLQRLPITAIILWKIWHLESVWSVCRNRFPRQCYIASRMLIMVGHPDGEGDRPRIWNLALGNSGRSSEDACNELCIPVAILS